MAESREQAHARRAALGAGRPLHCLPGASATLLSLSLQEEEASSRSESSGGVRAKGGGQEVEGILSAGEGCGTLALVVLGGSRSFFCSTETWALVMPPWD